MVSVYSVYAATKNHPQPYWTCNVELEESEAKTIKRRRKDSFGRYPLREEDIKDSHRFPGLFLAVELEMKTKLAIEIPDLHS